MKKIFRVLIVSVFVSVLCLGLTLCAHADNEIGKLLVSTGNAPAALMDVSSLSATTSTPGAYITSCAWYDNASGNLIPDRFGKGSCRVEISVGLLSGLVFSENVSVYLNNSPVDFFLSGDRTVISLYRNYTPVLYAPAVYKHPGVERPEIGAVASFVVSGSYVDSYEWFIESPDGIVYNAYEIPNLFDGSFVNSDCEPKLNISGVTAEMNNWQVFCKMTGPGGSVNTNSAAIKVKGVVSTPVPTEEIIIIDEEPESEYNIPEDAIILDEDEVPEPEPETEAETHVHSYSEAWLNDDEYHWRECECGEKTAVAEHDMSWTVLREATKKQPGTEKGVCSVCGYEKERSLAYENSSGGILKPVLIGVGALVGLTILVLAVDSARKSSRRKAAKKHSSSGTHSSPGKHDTSGKHSSGEYRGKH